jgi:serine phosphatase RsbU (regulator of sigma subunit)
VLYTDGLVDATNAAGEFFTLDRLKVAIAAGADRSSEGAAQLIAEKTHEWTRGHAADDLTFVLVDCV